MGTSNLKRIASNQFLWTSRIQRHYIWARRSVNESRWVQIARVRLLRITDEGKAGEWDDFKDQHLFLTDRRRGKIIGTHPGDYKHYAIIGVFSRDRANYKNPPKQQSILVTRNPCSRADTDICRGMTNGEPPSCDPQKNQNATQVTERQ